MLRLVRTSCERSDHLLQEPLCFFLVVDTDCVYEYVHGLRCADVNDNNLSLDVKVLDSVSMQIDN